MKQKLAAFLLALVICLMPCAATVPYTHLADKYDQDAEASKPRANQRIENSTQTAFTATTLGYATVLPQSTVCLLYTSRCV